MIYVDAFGGDNSPNEIIKGCVLAVAEYKEEITLLGDSQKINNVFNELNLSKEMIFIYDCKEVITLEEEPALAIRRKKDSTISLGCKLIKEEENSVFVSAGSSGALLAGGLFITGRIRGIKRPALAVTLPGKRPVLLIDSGANAECKSEFINQFAIMGSVYMESVFKVKNPKVGLVNIGVEEEKGSALYKETYGVLKENESINFVGNIEARDVLSGKVDVICCDGFTGNMILKTTEGVASYFKGVLKDIFYSSAKTKIGALLIKKNMTKELKKMDYKEYGGAPLLGVKGGIIKAHGSSDAKAIKNAINQAIIFERENVLAKIKKNL